MAVVELANPGTDSLAPDAPVTGAGTHQLAEGAPDYTREIRRLQRKLDRQHRAGSPDCFRQDGTHKTRCRWRDRSKNARQTQNSIAEIHRRLAAYRKTSHGTMVTEWLSVGPRLHPEKLDYVAWQKRFPRSVRDRALRELIEIARRRAASAGGKAYEYSTRTTALSQTCLCGRKEKKPLSQRIHHCPDCGLVVQRDLLSAFLGMFVRPEVDPTTGEIVGDTLDLDHARRAWSAAPDADWLAGETEWRHTQAPSPEAPAPVAAVTGVDQGLPQAAPHIRQRCSSGTIISVAHGPGVAMILGDSGGEGEEARSFGAECITRKRRNA